MLLAISHKAGLLDGSKGRALLLYLVFIVSAVLIWRLATDPASDDMNEDTSMTSTPVVSRLSTDGGFVGSSSCETCHQEQHASWFDSFHRTMTQRATPDTILAPIQNDWLEFNGQTYRLEQDGERLFVTTGAPAGSLNTRESPGPRNPQRREIVLTTGSHHIQVYWILNPSDQMLIEFPFYYHISSERWILRDDTMLHPPGQPQMPSTWNDRCVKCHSVNGVPGLDPVAGQFSTSVAELGIACEACHGPGGQHVELHRTALANNSLLTTEDSIVNPGRLDSHAATQVCGRCHSASQPRDAEQFLRTGLAYEPGDDLHAYLTLNEFDPNGERPTWDNAKDLFVEDYSIDGYWKDGTCRVGGDEYNALIQSPCYQRGELSCLSCHSLHQSDPNDQLAAHAGDNRACTQCHEETRFDQQLSSHTHHAAGSVGSQCYNCHMPHTTYALLTAMRSHRISTPSVADSVQFGKPNACNLCHLDRTLEWTSEKLAEWHGVPETELDEDQDRIAASLLWLLEGNAATRIIAAWHLGWRPALEASGAEWPAAHLAPLLDDPYSAVRFVTHQSLTNLPGYADFNYDFIGSPASRRQAAVAALDIWDRTRPQEEHLNRSAVLLDRDGRRRTREVVRLLRRGDNRPLSIAE